MNQLETLTKEIQKLRKALYECLKIDFDKPTNIEIENYDVLLYAELDRLERVRNNNRDNPIIYEVLDTYFKQRQELAYHFLNDLNNAMDKQNDFLISLTTQ